MLYLPGPGVSWLLSVSNKDFLAALFITKDITTKIILVIVS